MSLVVPAGVLQPLLCPCLPAGERPVSLKEHALSPDVPVA
jgi:hypothetical protein